jgi:hypothetical protein
MQRRRRISNSALFFYLAVIIFVAIHVPALSIKPCFDDWPLIKSALYPFQDYGFFRGLYEVLKAPVSDPPYFSFWRPLSALPLVIDGGRLFWPQLLKLLAVVGLAYLVVVAARALGLRRATSWITGALFCLHQCMVLGQEPDQWADIITIAAVLFLLCVALWVRQEKISRRLTLAVTFGTVILALLAKESGVMALAIPLLVLGAFWRMLPREQRITLILMAAVCVMLTAAYLPVRSHLGPAITSGGDDPYYRLHVGFNLLYNLLLSLLAFLSPVTTLKVAAGMNAWRMMAAIWVLTAGAVILWLIIKYRAELEWRVLALPAALFGVLLGPSLLMTHTTEQNFSRVLPFGLLFVGAVLERSWPKISPLLRRSLSIALALWLIFSLHATFGKVQAIVAVHKAGEGFRKRVVELMPVPPKREVLFVAEWVRKGYSCWGRPVWELARGGDVDDGLAFEYGDRSFCGRLVVVRSLDSIPASLPAPDFTIDKFGTVSRVDSSVTRTEHGWRLTGK